MNSREHFEEQFSTQPGVKSGFTEILKVKPVQEDALNLTSYNSYSMVEYPKADTSVF